MATLKDHQQAMVDLLASGSGIPASASRLAHAMHDVLAVLCAEPANPTPALKELMNRRKETTPGLNDKALAADVDACRHKDTMFDRARAAERRVKELENTVKQLRASNAILKEQRDNLGRQLAEMHLPEQAGCRKDDTQVCEHTSWEDKGCGVRSCCDCGALI